MYRRPIFFYIKHCIGFIYRCEWNLESETDDRLESVHMPCVL